MIRLGPARIPGPGCRSVIPLARLAWLLTPSCDSCPLLYTRTAWDDHLPPFHCQLGRVLFDEGECLAFYLNWRCSKAKFCLGDWFARVHLLSSPRGCEGNYSLSTTTCWQVHSNGENMRSTWAQQNWKIRRSWKAQGRPDGTGLLSTDCPCSCLRQRQDVRQPVRDPEPSQSSFKALCVLSTLDASIWLEEVHCLENVGSSWMSGDPTCQRPSFQGAQCFPERLSEVAGFSAQPLRLPWKRLTTEPPNC